MRLGRALMVAAHADDESPGLGAVLEALVGAGIEVPAALPHGRGGFDCGCGIPAGGAARWGPVVGAHGSAERRRGGGVAVAQLLVGFERLGVTGHPGHAAATAGVPGGSVHPVGRGAGLAR